MPSLLTALPRPLPRLRLALALLGALAAGTACSALDDALSPGRRGEPSAPARLALSAEIGVQASVAAEARLRLQPSYLRSDDSRVALTPQTVTLDAAATQQLPFSIDLATCLNDAQRKRPAGSDESSCVVVLQLTLLDGDTPVDQQTLSALTLRAGGAVNVTEPVRLFQIASVRVTPSIASPTGSAQVAQGSTLTLTAALLSTTGQTVTGRPVSFQSDAPTIARVDATTGVVTGVAPGRARITALVGTTSGSIEVVVTPPPSPITVVGGTGSGSGTVRSSPAGIDCRIVAGVASGSCTAPFASDAQVTLTATADAGSVFGAFAGSCAGTTCVVDASQARSVSASFVALRRITVAGAGGGTGTVTGPGIACTITAGVASGTCSGTALDGTNVTLTASPGPGQSFLGFTGACATTASTCTIPLTADASVTAQFATLQPLTIALGGTGGGTVSVSVPAGAGSGFICTITANGSPPPCAANFPPGTVVTVTATPAPGSTFAGFTGACTGAGLCSVTIDRATSIGASFTQRSVTFTVTVGGAGGGSVLVNGAAACTLAAGEGSRSCTLTVGAGTPLTLTAAAAPGSQFAGFTGPCASAGASCTITPLVDTSVGAAFVPIAIGVSVQGTAGALGSGTVTSAPNGISCSVTGATVRGTCSATFAFGTVLTLTATPAPGSTFAGWGGECIGATGPTCTITIRSTVTPIVTANFALAATTVPLTVTLAGNGTGAVTSSPSGISCPSTCSYPFPSGSVVTLTATPATGSTFAGWGGACSNAGTSPTCTTTLTSATSVTATFTSSPVTVQLFGVTGSTGSGILFSSGATPALNCSVSGAIAIGVCSGSYTRSGTLTITAQPNTGSVFAGFTGVCSGATSNVCTIPLASAPSTAQLSVRFAPSATIELIMTDYDGAHFDTVTVTANGIPYAPCTLGSDTSSTRHCTYAVPAGATVRYATTASRFIGFDGACSESYGAVTCTFTAANGVGAYATYGSGSLIRQPAGAPPTPPAASRVRPRPDIEDPEPRP